MKESQLQTEDQLIENCIRGERMSQKRLYEIYSSSMFTLCIKYTKNETDAEDVLQEGFVKLFNNLHFFRHEGSFEGWVRRIFANTAVEVLRRRNILSFTGETLENVLAENQVSALDNLYEKDIINRSQALSNGYKTIFNLYAVEGFSHKEIAIKLGISESTSKSQFCRAKALMRTMILNEEVHLNAASRN